MPGVDLCIGMLLIIIAHTPIPKLTSTFSPAVIRLFREKAPQGLRLVKTISLDKTKMIVKMER